MKLGPELIKLVPNPFYGVITNPTSSLSRATVEWRQLQKPWPHYSSIFASRKPGADSIYHAMTLRVDKRFSSGLSFLFAYTAGKLIDDASNAVTWLGPVANQRMDNNNRRLERAVSSMDIAQRAVFSYVYELPFGKGKRHLASLPVIADRVVSGWQINGITTFQSGTPLILFAASTNTGISSGQRPLNNGASGRLTGGTTDERLARWFNTSAFSQPAQYTFGNTGRTLPDTRNPGIRGTDLSVFKNNYFGPERRMNLQYRVEMFGAFNTPQFSGPATTVGSNSFGVISGASGARTIQMALKLNW